MAKTTKSRAHSVLGGKSKSASKGKHPHSIHVRRGKSGGFIVTHHHAPDEDGTTPEPEDHVVPDLDSLQSHMAENMGDQGPAPAPTPPPPDAGAAAPPTGAPAGPGAGGPPVAPAM